MMGRLGHNPALLGATSAVIAVIFFSINDMLIKSISGAYALHQVMLIRALVAMVVLSAVVLPFAGGFAALRTRRLGLHMIRALFVVASNMAFFLGLAAMPLAESVAIFFVSPLVITVFSVIFLGEHVGPRRWIAVAFGMLGVIIVLRPGSEAFKLAGLLPLLSAIGYAAMHMLTRYIGRTESAATMTIYINVAFLIVGLLAGLALGDGRYAGSEDASLAFLLRAWAWPTPHDWVILITTGTSVTLAGYFISLAYKVAEAAMVAPIEYLALPLAVVWGFVMFGEIPDATSSAGIALILGSGLFMVWRETAAARPKRR